jgi:MerR family transcriptional regulator, light-induced transcriptional regulator
MSKDLVAIEDRFYRSGELARLLHVDDSTVKRWADRGLIGCYRTPGGHRKFTAHQIREFIQAYGYRVIADETVAMESIGRRIS